MEFTAAATKRLNQYAFLPSKKTKKYVDVHSLYLKAAHSYLGKAQQATNSQHSHREANASTSAAPQPPSATVTAASTSSTTHSSAAASSLYANAAESFTSAANLSARKLQLMSSAMSSHLEAAVCYQQAEEWELAYEALKRAMEARELCIQQKRVSPQAAPGSARLSAVPPLAGSTKEDRRRGRRRSDAGPIREVERTSKSMPGSPILTAKHSQNISVTAPGSPQPEERARRTGMLSRMKKLMVRTNKDKDKQAEEGAKAVSTNGDTAATETAAAVVSVISPVDVSPLPPLTLPRQANPPSPQLHAATAPSSPQPQPVDINHLLPPLAATTSVSSPPSPSLDILPGSLQSGQLPAQSRLLLDPQFSLLMASFAASLGFELWEDLSRKSALDCFEIAFRLLAVLDEPALCLHCPATLMRQSHATLQLLYGQVASFYLAYHDSAVDGKQPWECDLRLLQRARELLIATAKLRCEQQPAGHVGSNGANDTRHTDGEGQVDGSHSTTDQHESLASTGLPSPVQKAILSHSSSSLETTLFSACVCDAIITAYTHNFNQRVLFTPPLLHSSLLLSPSFFATLECRFVRQLYGLLQLSSSAPARFIQADPPPPASSPEEQYRRLLLSLWGNEILNEFVLLLTRFLYEKRGLEPPKPLTPASAARGRHEEGKSNHKVHPLVAMVKDDTDSLVASVGADGGVDAVDGTGMQLLMKVKRIIKHNVTVPGYMYSHRTAATAV